VAGALCRATRSGVGRPKPTGAAAQRRVNSPHLRVDALSGAPTPHGLAAIAQPAKHLLLPVSPSAPKARKTHYPKKLPQTSPHITFSVLPSPGDCAPGAHPLSFLKSVCAVDLLVKKPAARCVSASPIRSALMRAAQAFYSATWGRRPARGGVICDSLTLAQKPGCKKRVLVWVARKTSPRLGKSSEVEAMHSLPLMAGFMAETGVFGFPSHDCRKIKFNTRLHLRYHQFPRRRWKRSCLAGSVQLIEMRLRVLGAGRLGRD